MGKEFSFEVPDEFGEHSPLSSEEQRIFDQTVAQVSKMPDTIPNDQPIDDRARPLPEEEYWGVPPRLGESE